MHTILLSVVLFWLYDKFLAEPCSLFTRVLGLFYLAVGISYDLTASVQMK